MFGNTIAEDKSYAKGTMNKHGYTLSRRSCKVAKKKIRKNILKKIEIVVEQFF